VIIVLLIALAVLVLLGAIFGIDVSGSGGTGGDGY
jgi:hypothetical protein